MQQFFAQVLNRVELSGKGGARTDDLARPTRRASTFRSIE
jgi:hypothetical protein